MWQLHLASVVTAKCSLSLIQILCSLCHALTYCKKDNHQVVCSTKYKCGKEWASSKVWVKLWVNERGNPGWYLPSVTKQEWVVGAPSCQKRMPTSRKQQPWGQTELLQVTCRALWVHPLSLKSWVARSGPPRRWEGQRLWTGTVDRDSRQLGGGQRLTYNPIWSYAFWSFGHTQLCYPSPLVKPSSTKNPLLQAECKVQHLDWHMWWNRCWNVRRPWKYMSTQRFCLLHPAPPH